jgi:hypothetical protein
MNEKTTLSDILIFLMRRRTKRHRAYGVTLREHFPQADIDHLVQLQVIGCRHEIDKGDVYWVRPIREPRTTAYSYSRAMEMRAARYARMKVAA